MVLRRVAMFRDQTIKENNRVKLSILFTRRILPEVSPGNPKALKGDRWGLLEHDFFYSRALFLSPDQHRQSIEAMHSVHKVTGLAANRSKFSLIWA